MSDVATTSSVRHGWMDSDVKPDNAWVTSHNMSVFVRAWLWGRKWEGKEPLEPPIPNADVDSLRGGETTKLRNGRAVKLKSVSLWSGVSLASLVQIWFLESSPRPIW